MAKFSQSVLVSPQTSTVYYVFGMDGTTLAEALLPPPEPCVCPPDVVCTDAVCDEEQRGAAVVAGHEEDILGLQWRHYVYLEGVPIAVLDAGGLTYLETDHLGSPRAAISPTTNASVWRWTFAASAFGENLPNEQPGGSAPFKLNLRFPGQYYDAESGMHYNYFRDYEPGTGRYVESDPIGLRGGISTYGYALASPLEFSDPTGEASVLGAAAVGCVAGCLANVGAPFGKCVYSGLQKGDSLEECNRDCKPTFCAFVNQCFQGCLAGGLLAGVAGAALGGSMTATYGVMVGGGTSVLAGSLYKEVFKFDVCGALSGLGPTGERLGEGQ